MLYFRKCPNRVNHVFGHILAKNYPTVCFFGLHMLFCHPGHFLFYDLQAKSDWTLFESVAFFKKIKNHFLAVNNARNVQGDKTGPKSTL